ncbi:glycolipid 2-alpha-mannosyltransferase-domain-containing protein [Lipomyces japonicus]|uniref:glycolipid 2-alpha-mannosyltransferase-domain-containing protein n=1 Tax=Lipomyces japonicus TaxID=56871 RepID=UPI0034CD70EB
MRLTKRWRQAIVFAIFSAILIAVASRFQGAARKLLFKKHEKRVPGDGRPLTFNPLMQPVGEPRGRLVRADDDSQSRANATLLVLARNSEINGLVRTMKDVERTFNSKFNYPWTFFNDEPFSEQFKRRTQASTKATCRYEIIPREHWDTPKWINQDILDVSNDILVEDNIMYAKLPSYRKMCRWNSGLFYQHPALKDFRWYWRIEPNTKYFCSIDYDVFKYMEDNDKTYGYVINIYDSPQSIRTLWPTTLEFIAQHPEYVDSNNSLQWLIDDKVRPDHNRIANGYSTCHFWSNFEIGDMNFFRGKAYSEYFNYLDQRGGFFYERWGDAPVHSIGLGLFLDKTKIHWFKDIGYVHQPYYNCPMSDKCSGCKAGKFTDADWLSPENCIGNFFKYGHAD